ncbi:succinylglutamate-semialdehyde dehydrogenase [Vibrio sp. RC27]
MTHFIAGEWLEGEGGFFESHKPYDGRTVWSGYSASDHQVECACRAARLAFYEWKTKDFKEREQVVLKFAELVECNADLLAQTISEETGKPLWETKGEVAATKGKIPISIQAYHERSGDKYRENDEQRFVLRHRPLGVMAVFGPYNFPCHLPNGHIVPALLAGNCVVLKPSEQTPKCAEIMVTLWQQAGLPDGVLNLVQGGSDTGIALAKMKQIDGLLFTGSASTGHTLHRQFAGQPEKMLALEMGGNNPLVVSSHFGDIDAAVYTIIQSAFISSGQRCTCARRLYIPDCEGGDALLTRLIEVVEALDIDQPFAVPAPFMGPLISAQAADHVIEIQKNLVSLGAKILVIAQRKEHAFVTPAILDVSNIVDLPDEECFGPLLQVIRYSSLEAAVEMANDTQFGLSAGLISTQHSEWHYFVDHIRAGIVNLNRQLTGASSDAPFGGPGASGNLRPSAYYAADYCAYPMASIEGEQLELPTVCSPGIHL